MTDDKFKDEILDDDELDQVAGGTFTPNKYDERIYNQAGLRTQYHVFEKDEFFAKSENGKEVPITYDQANRQSALLRTHRLELQQVSPRHKSEYLHENCPRRTRRGFFFDGDEKIFVGTCNET